MKFPEALSNGKERDNCPHCGYYLTYRLKTNGEVYRRTLLVEIPGHGDVGLYWKCPECLGTWHRWSGDTGPLSRKYHEWAEDFMTREANAREVRGT